MLEVVDSRGRRGGSRGDGMGKQVVKEHSAVTVRDEQASPAGGVKGYDAWAGGLDDVHGLGVGLTTPPRGTAGCSGHEALSGGTRETVKSRILGGPESGCQSLAEPSRS